MKRHLPTEIEQKLATASFLATNGISQQDICRRLGISVMTLHRWRKGLRAASQAEAETALLQENRRLRDIASNILIETQALKERYLDMLSQQKQVETARPRSRQGQENPEIVTRQVAGANAA